jgi:hypothetical protein
VRSIHEFNSKLPKNFPLAVCFFVSISSSELLPETQYFAAMIFQGTFYLFQLGAFTNMALFTSEKNRTMRFGILTAMFSLASEKKLKTDFWTNYDSPFLTYVVLILVLSAGLVVLILVDGSEESSSDESKSMMGSLVDRYLRWFFKATNIPKKLLMGHC